jgi:hypothetical protein
MSSLAVLLNAKLWADRLIHKFEQQTAFGQRRTALCMQLGSG